MNKKRVQKQGVIVRIKKDPYASALKEFIGMTNKDPSFFKLSPEDQKKVAMEHIQKQKMNLGQEREEDR